MKTRFEEMGQAVKAAGEPVSGMALFPSAVGNWDNKYDSLHNKWPVSKILASIPESAQGR
jgi:hypothetical protein